MFLNLFNKNKPNIKKNMFVGKYTYGHENIIIKKWDNSSNLKIGSFCSIAENVKCILGGNHNYLNISTYPFGRIFFDSFGRRKIKNQIYSNGDINIGNDVWIGEGVTIMSGVTIDHGCIVAANSHVVKNTKPYEIIGGNPAKLISKRFNPAIIKLLLQIKWWDFNVNKIKRIRKILNSKPTRANIKKLIE
jgi:acetyltransferase-like isoleucine patch superfamily enzyme